MLLPSTNDTIVAVSSGWAPSPVGIVRLSGPESHDLVDALVKWREPVRANERLEQLSQSSVPAVGDRCEQVSAETELLVLGSHAPVLRRLLAASEVVDEIGDALGASIKLRLLLGQCHEPLRYRLGCRRRTAAQITA